MNTIKENSTQLVDVKNYNKRNEPQLVALHNLSCPRKHQYILRMPIMVDGENYKIPYELFWLTEAITDAIEYQRDVIGIKHTFCYVTVRHGIVASATDDEWHVDGFSTKISHIPEQNYIICDHTPTEYVTGAVKFSDRFDSNKHNVNEYLESAFEDTEVHIQSIPPNVMTVMDPYILHRRPHCTAGVMRTFARISFVPIEINDINNTQNPELPRTYTNDGVKTRNKLETFK
jgi:hypothetical protein